MSDSSTRPPTCLGLITARKGSRGLPDKHLRPLGSRPLIEWTFDAARSSRTLTRVVLSTDDERLLALAGAGIEAPFRRPEALCTDEASHLDVVRHAFDWHVQDTGALPDLLMLLQPTSPFRIAQDIDTAVMQAWNSGRAVVGVSECRDHPARTYSIGSKGQLMPYGGETASPRRQDLPPAYRVNGAIYAIAPQRLLATGQFVPSDAMPLFMPIARSVDIDTEIDLAWAEFCVASGLFHRS